MASKEGGSNWDSSRLRRQLQSMDDFQFEHLVADLWEEQGWETKVEQQSTDAGIDVRAQRSSPYKRKALIQAKRYSDSNPVGGPDIQQYSALKRQEPDVDEVVIVTTGRFTGAAEDRAEDLNVKIIDGQDLVVLIDDLNAYDLIEGYIGPPGGYTHATRDSKQDTQRASQNIDVQEYLDNDIDSVKEEDEYQRIRAKEREEDRVRLNPHDASLMGVFDGLPEEVTEDRFQDTKHERAILKDDLHLTDSGELFVEDLTDYIRDTAINTHAQENVIGVIERGVKDGTWASEDGYEYLKNKQRYEEFKRWVRQVIERSKSWYQDYSDKDSSEDLTEQTQISISGEEVEEGPVTSSDQAAQQERISPTSEPADGLKEGASDGTVETTTLDDTVWYKLTMVGTGAWAAFWVLTIAGVLQTVSGLLVLGAMITLPVGIILDARETGAASVATVETILYAVTALIPAIGILGGIAYLYRRQSGSWV